MRSGRAAKAAVESACPTAAWDRRNGRRPRSPWRRGGGSAWLRLQARVLPDMPAAWRGEANIADALTRDVHLVRITG